MIIRKEFKFEAAHVVRKCTSLRCKQNIHGHSYIVEVFFSSKGLDNGQMVLDFGLTKPIIGKLIDIFDHSWHYWNEENKEFKDFVSKYNERWIELPFNPSAENYAIFFLKAITNILKEMKFENGEKEVICTGVRVHETRTGYAESQISDLPLHNYYNLSDVKFSWESQEDINSDLVLWKVFKGME